MELVEAPREDEHRRDFLEKLHRVRTEVTVEEHFQPLSLEEAKAVAEAIQANPRLKTLNFMASICPEGAGPRLQQVEALAAGLRGSTVTSLGLDWNHLRDEGVIAVAAVLPETCVQRLDLSRNFFGEEGARALAAALKSSCVTSLGLFANEMGDLGGKALLEGLRDSSVIDIELDNCDIGDELFSQIQEALKANKARSFVLQMEVKESEEKLDLTFRTLAGTVAVALTWSLDSPVQDLPQTVLRSMRSAGFPPAFNGLGTVQLKLLRPDGGLLDVAATAASLAKQLGLEKAPQGVKRPRAMEGQ